MLCMFKHDVLNYHQVRNVKVRQPLSHNDICRYNLNGGIKQFKLRQAYILHNANEATEEGNRKTKKICYFFALIYNVFNNEPFEKCHDSADQNDLRAS